MSISPFRGHAASSVIQNAGQTPHPSGMCRTSNTNSPRSNRVLPSSRTESRGPSSVGAEAMYANVPSSPVRSSCSVTTLAMPLDRAFDSET